MPWLEPVPDAMVGDERADPAELAVSRETIRLAFVAALQFLPARQRAVLLLRDVLRWSAAEVAEAMQTTTAAVNSLLQRAHAQLEQAGPLDETVADASALTAQQQAMLERYVAAFWEKDVDTLVTMFTQDAIWEMPPFLNWYRGPRDIGKLIGEHCPGGRHDMRMVETVANGQPAFGLYMRTPRGRLPSVPPAGAVDRAGRCPPRRGVLRAVAVREVRAARVACRPRRTTRPSTLRPRALPAAPADGLVG